jgi:hypothetical protein
MNAIEIVRKTLVEVDGLTASAIASFADMPASRLSAVMSGKIPITAVDADELTKVCAKISAVAAAFAPAPLAWNRVDKIRKLFRGLDEGKIYARVLVESQQ